MAKATARAAGAALALLLGTTAAPQPASAFCGFFVSGADTQLLNNASQAVLLRKGNHTVMTLSNNYQGPPEDFAMVVPVPVVLQKPNVKTLNPNIFSHIDQLSAPRLVEYWEQDPCNQPDYEEAEGRMDKKASPMKRAKAEAAGDSLGVKVEAQFTVGEYEIVILSAQDSTGLDKWLRINKYKIPAGAAAALAPYVRDQMKFFVAKVDISKVRRDSHGHVVLSPLRFGFDAAELRLPIRLGLLNAPSGNDPAAKQDLIVYVLHPDSRYEVANYPNVFIPTNIEVADAVRTQFGSFYAELFDEALRRAHNRAVITEYAWQTTSCDPCPSPPLSYSDLYTLGDEQVFGQASNPADLQLKRAMPGRGRGGFFGGGPTWVLTRMHARYDKATMSEDLVFRAAKPVLGGRANWDGTVGDQGAQVQEGGVNNFQGRYIIRHYWEGAVSCASPRYGVWGGPPSSVAGSSRPQAAGDLANAQRGKLSLASIVRSPVPTLGLTGVVRKLRKGETPPQSQAR